jgi:uncharacterized RDD family membrane protein YckC
MAVFGLRVVTTQGGLISTRQAAVRTLILPVSIILLIVTFFCIVFQRERRALHDLAAGTVVVYAWDARAARLRWISRSESTPEPAET